MQSSQIPGKIHIPWDNTNVNKRSIPDASQIGITNGAASWTDGFPPLCFTPYASGGLPPNGLDMNGVFYTLSAINLWNVAGGVYPWDSSFSSNSYVGGYPLGSHVASSDLLGQWVSQAENNTSNPETYTGGAQSWFPGDATQVSIAVSNANITLTALQANKSTIVLTGALTSNIIITVPEFPGKKWTFICEYTNASNHAISIVTAASSTVMALLMSDNSFGNGIDIVLDGNGVLVPANRDTAQVVPNVTLLRQATYLMNTSGTVYNRMVRTLGYNSAGDSGGGLTFQWVWNGTSGYYVDNGGTIFTAGTGGKGAWVALPGQTITQLHFGADPTATNDSTSAINNYIAWSAAAASSAGKVSALNRVFLSAGVFKITQLTAHLGLTFIGEGAGPSPAAGSGYTGYGGTVLECTATSGAAIAVGSGTQLQSSITFEKMRITSSGAGASIGVQCSYANENVVFRDAIVDGFSGSGVSLSNCDHTTFDNTVLYNNGTNLNIGTNCAIVTFDKSNTISPSSGNHIAVTGSGCLGLNITNSGIVGGTIDQIAVQSGATLRGLNIKGNKFSATPSTYSAIILTTNGTIGADIDGNTWDAIQGTFLSVQSGNADVKLDNMSYSSSWTSAAKYVNFSSGATNCVAYLPTYGNVPNGTNNSASCRVYNKPNDEVGASEFQTGTQSFTASSATTIVWGGANYDPKSEFSGSTSYQPKDYGQFDVTYTLLINPSTMGDQNYVISLYNTNTSAALGYQTYNVTGNNNPFTATGTFKGVRLAPTDVVVVQLNPTVACTSTSGQLNSSVQFKRVG